MIRTIWSSSHHAKKRVIELLHLSYILGLICLELQTLQKTKDKFRKNWAAPLLNTN